MVEQPPLVVIPPTTTGVVNAWPEEQVVVSPAEPTSVITPAALTEKFAELMRFV
jgi:hypothetical protein